jgi:predicted RNA-binding protein with PUA-like domain
MGNPGFRTRGGLWLCTHDFVRVRTGEQYPLSKTIKHPLTKKDEMVNYWLAKQEPSGPRGYDFEQLKKEKSTVWDGVHNNLALKHMREMKPGDLAFFYHTGDERQAVGIMQITSKPYPNPKEDVERFIVVDVKYKKSLKNPVTLDEMKKNKKFKDWELLRISRLSVMPVPKPIWDEILKMSQG